MVNQPVPEVTDDDVRRITRRDFGDALFAAARLILEEQGKQPYETPSARIRLAILKLANQNLERLKVYTEVAIKDFRDVLGEAEYPRYMREIGFRDVPEELEKACIDDDWKQYSEWLRKE